MKVPNSIITKEPREAISFGISIGIRNGVLAEKFKMTPQAWDALIAYLDKKWEKTGQKEMAKMIECFTVGYAIGTDQFPPYWRNKK